MKRKRFSDSLKKMRFMARGDDQNELRLTGTVDDQLAQLFFGKSTANFRGIVVDHRHSSFCDFGCPRLSFLGFNPEVEQIMKEYGKTKEGASKTQHTTPEDNDDVEMEDGELPDQCSVQWEILNKLPRKRHKIAIKKENVTDESSQNGGGGSPSSAAASPSFTVPRKKANKKSVGPVAAAAPVVGRLAPTTRGVFVKPEPY